MLISSAPVSGLFVQTCSVDEGSYDDDGGGAFMQLAASVGLAGATGGGRAESEAAPCSCHAQVLEATGASSALLRQAVLSKAPGVHRPERAESYAPKSLAADAAGVCSACGRALGGTQGGADVYSLDATGPDTTFAVVPLAYGQGTMGVLWIAFASALPAPAQAQGPATAAPSPDGPTASPGSSKAASALPALLGSPAALQHLAISASMALAAGADDPMHLRWLAGSLRRLHASASLAELVGVLCGTLAHYVRRRFLLEVAAQAALAPGANAKVAFMLRAEAGGEPLRTQTGPPLSSAFRLRFSSNASAASVPTLAARITEHVQPSRSVSQMQTPVPAIKESHSLRRILTLASDTVPNPASSAGQQGRPSSYNLAQQQRDVFLIDSTPARSALSNGLMSQTVAAPGPALVARPFRLSNTLFQAMTEVPREGRDLPIVVPVPAVDDLSAVVPRPPSVVRVTSGPQGLAAPPMLPPPSVEGGVLAGLCVRDCARHVQDERQPSRDVMMLGSGGAQSLVLVGMEAGEGAVLGGVLASHVRYRLRSPELASEWETLLAGVPGAYVSVSRGGGPVHPSCGTQPGEAAEALLEHPPLGSARRTPSNNGHNVSGSHAKVPHVAPPSPLPPLSPSASASHAAASPRRPPSTNHTLGSPRTPQDLSRRRSLVRDLLNTIVGNNSHTPEGKGGAGSAKRANGAESGVQGQDDEASWPTAPSGEQGDIEDSANGNTAGAGTPALLTVHDLEETYESWGMRAQMGALVESIMRTTLRSNDANATGDGLAFPDHASRATEGLEELQLSAVLGQGASGVVLQGTLGCAPVAVKLIEMPDADVSGFRPGDKPSIATAPELEGLPGAKPAGDSEDRRQQETRARRDLLRNAMEVAVMRSVCHVNILQALGFYDNVVMERHEGQQGTISLRRVHQQHQAPLQHLAGVGGGAATASPVCTAIVMEMCDRGSLVDALYAQSFPALPSPPPHPKQSNMLTAGASMQYARYWKGVYMTLLEVALALRYLHARRLVHRDLKPGNVLLRSNAGDTRGWTCKLADFGFALVLDQRPEDARKDADPSTPAVGALRATVSCSRLAVSGPALGGAAGGPAAREPSGWFAVQQQAAGTVTHMAPEAFRKNCRIDASVDVFSFGIIMQLAALCWSADPQQRPSAAELVTMIKGMLAAVKSG
ncbi:hypothetical protein HYH03_005435 [Edaphochlamys debaryana]|uniref:Protein kinase domain-containing protein n=1 Tax=Edaphochlamys debaryana TaxID=47281 RepID=A0A836C2H8_9CHLO|nr:hypothetical protein HYH03_005435 [Edaphochlamys debaryana]|eukprot:KAG2496614.1 hypothetical protein HYH03_005435 [Edaphochlamys debaryana]